MKDSMAHQVADSGEKVGFLVVPPDVFDQIMQEYSEMALRSETGITVFKDHPLANVTVICDKNQVATGSEIAGIFMDHDKHPTRIVMRTEATGRMLS